MKIAEIKFDHKIQPEFIKVLRERVNNYFQSNNISRYGNAQMVLKTIVMIALFGVPYGLMLSGLFTNPWIILLLWVVMGVGVAGIGLSIMHDANHGAYSRNKQVNKIMSFIMYFVGGSALNWQIQHNVLHHTYTNVEGMDEDIDAGKLLRFSPHQELHKFHRFQYIYAWFLYGLMTHMWITTKDFKQLWRYHKDGMLSLHGRTFRSAFTELLIFKAIYYVYMLVIPILVVDIPWWMTLSFFLIMHFVVGLILTSIFQTAHVMSTSEYPLPNEKGTMENNWAIHQLLTTANYADSSRIFSWYIGGLNYQIEHHLFPTICHVHYKKLSRIVRQTAQEFGLPYNSQPTFVAALRNHTQMLKALGTGADSSN